MHRKTALALIFFGLFVQLGQVASQSIEIIDFELDRFDRPLVTVESDASLYYTLYALNPGASDFHPVQMEIGTGERLTLSESLIALPREAYKVEARPISIPADQDHDGINDVEELLNPTSQAPLNTASSVDQLSGAITLKSSSDFLRLARARTTGDTSNQVDLYAVSKIYLVNNTSDSIQGYFVNTNEHEFHVDFANAVGIATRPNGVSFTEDMRGTLIFHPEVLSKNGVRGLYTFHFGFFNDYSFEIIQRAHDLLAVNMPFLKGNLAYRPRFDIAIDEYESSKSLYDASRIQVVLEEELFAGIDYLPLNEEIGFGRLRILEPGLSPSPFDIVISESVPDELPRVAGILTGSVQTPLAHVNLRAIQDGIPNAFVRDVFSNPKLTPLIGEFVKLTVLRDSFEVRQATKAEVDNHFAEIRPDSIQVLVSDLSKTSILPLDQIRFEDVTSVGAKSANLGQLTTLPFEQGTLPEGFAIPFYFYDRFMLHNGLYQEAASLLSDTSFRQNLAQQQTALEAFRRKIEFGIIPLDLFDQITDLQGQFDPSSFIRCRSSSNNEDLPGFSGAGLYDSKTHRPDEGHLVKTIRQVFAGLWTYRAFVEREFYNIDHLSAKMGVLVHLSYKDELANGVGVSIDPLYGTENQYYLNSQFQEVLVTNPNGSVSPEEILLSEADLGSDLEYDLVRPSSLIPVGVLLLDSFQLIKTRDYLKLIHEEFQVLYHAENAPDFAMEIEYKVDKNNQFIIKQARPWVGFSRSAEDTDGMVSIPALDLVYPNPASNVLYFPLTLERDYKRINIRFFNSTGALFHEQEWTDLPVGNQTLSVNLEPLPIGLYIYQIQMNAAYPFSGKVLIR